MKRRTGSFTAQGDDHKIYTIYEFTDFEDIRTHDDYATVKIPGSRELRTSDGTPVNYKEKGVYQIVSNGMILRSDALDAP